MSFGMLTSTTVFAQYVTLEPSFGLVGESIQQGAFAIKEGNIRCYKSNKESDVCAIIRCPSKSED
tara:strand:+ start:94 stop:288 length:195 start_codon:yes stop_codon:yes gene_type:complete